MLIANQVNASPLTRSLEANLRKAEAVERQEHQRYQYAKSSYNASKDKVRSAERRLKAALKDERREEAQLRAIEEANARYYEIPSYRYNSGDTELSWKAVR